MAIAPSKPPLRIDLPELETFIAVAEMGSFSLAAQHLHLTQPSVTSRVQRLEAALGTKLLARTTRKVEPTEDGARLLAEANLALAGLRTLVDGFVERAKQARQRVVVAATPTLAALVMPQLIRDYSRRFTDVQVQLLDMRYADVLAALDQGSADFAVLAYEGRDERFVVVPLHSEDVVLVVPPGHRLAGLDKVTLKHLADEELLLIDQYQPMRQSLAEAMRQRGLVLRPTTSVGNLTTLLGMLDARMGVALLSRSVALRRRLSGDKLLEVEEVKLRRNYALVYLRKAELGTAAESFLRFLVDPAEGGGLSYWSRL